MNTTVLLINIYSNRQKQCNMKGTVKWSLVNFGSFYKKKKDWHQTLRAFCVFRLK